jgi:hypothetical protein
MELRDLNHDEQLALLGLVQFIGESNHQVTDEESESIGEIVKSLGAAHYRKVAGEADERFGDEEALREFLEGVGRPEARELIYGAALEVALSDTMGQGESDLLDWLADAWEIEVSVGDEDGD